LNSPEHTILLYSPPSAQDVLEYIINEIIKAGGKLAGRLTDLQSSASQRLRQIPNDISNLFHHFAGTELLECWRIVHKLLGAI
jgi:hypothetical protein